MFGMIAKKKAKMAGYFLMKNEGRRVQFDVEKIYKALVEGIEEVTLSLSDGSQTRSLLSRSCDRRDLTKNVFQIA